MKLKTIIIEEPQGNLEKIFRFSVHHLPESLEFAGKATTVAEGIEMIIRNDPDIVLLDLDIQGGGGISVLRKTLGFHFHSIVFSEFKRNGLRVSRFGIKDFLTKDQIADEFLPTLKRTFCRCKGASVGQMFKDYCREVSGISIDHLMYRKGDGVRYIPLKEIVEVIQEPEGFELSLTSERTLRISGSFGKWKRRAAVQGFFKMKKGNWVNLDHIAGLETAISGGVILSTGKICHLSQDRFAEIIRRVAGVS